MLAQRAALSSAFALFLSLGSRNVVAEQEQEKPLPEEVTAHHKGRPPKAPADRLPESVELPRANERARRSIAEGPTSDDLAKGVPAEELLALQEAEQVLFPEPMRGLQQGWAFHLPQSSGESSRTLGLPVVTSAYIDRPALSPQDEEWIGGLTLPDLPMAFDSKVVTYLKFYRDSQQGRTIAAIWTKKSGRFVAQMKNQLRRAGLPTDLVWLSMIESGHNPTIKSPAGAVGLWQFMPESARMYGLVVDRWVDERRDPARSTQAAVRLLSDLYRRFGNWELAMGAYNMGYAGMSRAIAKFSSNDYWALSRLESGIPWETSLYVPKIFALAVVMNNRSAFGVGRTQLDPPVSFDTIFLEPATSLAEVAKVAQLSLDELSELNPQYLTNRLPPLPPAQAKKWPLRLPKGKGTEVLAKVDGKKADSQLYRTRLGENAESIASSYGISFLSLQALNGLTSGERLETGTVLFLPPEAKRRESSEAEAVVVGRALAIPSDQRRVFYSVQSGDSLELIAAAFSVKESDLRRWNLIHPGAFLREGMTLQVLVDKDQDLADVVAREEGQSEVLVAGSPEFHDYFEGLKGRQRLVITVQKGDTLRKIGARYGMSVGSMERVNHRSRRSELLAGEELIVYTERKARADSSDGGVQPLPPLTELGHSPR